jgi:nucleoid-associated protein EbfC
MAPRAAVGPRRAAPGHARKQVNGMEPGGLDMQQLFAAAAQMQSQLMDAQQQLAETEIEGSAGGGLVKVTISGQGELVDVTIAKEAIDSGDPAETASTLSDLILAASRDAYRALADVQAEAMGPLAGSLGGAGGGIPGLPGMPGMPGQPPAPGTGQPTIPGTTLPDDKPAPGEG